MRSPFGYNDDVFLEQQRSHYPEAFNHAHNEVCKCALGFIDSEFETAEFKKNFTIEEKLNDNNLCADNVNDFECYYKIREFDAFDLTIENVAKDGCTVCYGVGPNLWPLTENQLINTLTRSIGDVEDCTPKQGYHKSRVGEIFRCERGDYLTGVIAFTDANWSIGGSFPCGIFGGGDAFNQMEPSAIFLVRLN